jgi:hypothetical protein
LAQIAFDDVLSQPVGQIFGDFNLTIRDPESLEPQGGRNWPKQAIANTSEIKATKFNYFYNLKVRIPLAGNPIRGMTSSPVGVIQPS